jgi:hypothetical protein
MCWLRAAFAFPGASLKELMTRLGHSSTRAALIYQHATRDRDQAIAKALGGLVEQVRTSGDACFGSLWPVCGPSRLSTPPSHKERVPMRVPLTWGFSVERAKVPEFRTWFAGVSRHRSHPDEWGDE